MAMGDPICACPVPMPVIAEVRNPIPGNPGRDYVEDHLTGGCARCAGEMDDAALARYRAACDAESKAAGVIPANSGDE